jgi:hypothetical protein
VLYLVHQWDLGCPTPEKCDLISLQADACSGCPKQLRPVEPDPDPLIGRRLSYLTRLESLINFGCKLGLDDLPSQVWDELLILGSERQRMDAVVREQKDESRAKDVEAERKMAAARKESGVPPPGVSLFPSKRVR